MVCNYLTLIPLNICGIKLEEHKKATKWGNRALEEGGDRAEQD